MGFTSLFNRVAAGATAALPLGRPPRQPPTGAPPPPAINPQDVALPQDSLPADSLVPQFLGHFGVPDNADKLAYDPHQRLLAVSCTDGRVKVYGGEGAEVLFCSPSHTSTRQLLFLPHRLAVLRIAEDGLVEAFSLIAPYQRTAALHDLADTDPPHCAVSLPMEDSQDVIMLGCASGAMRVARASAAPYGNRTTSLQIRALRLMPYCVGPRDWCDAKVEGPLLALEPQPRNETDCVMVVHGDGLIVWSLSHGGAAASVHRIDGGTDAFADVGDLHAGCWAASDASLAASAHSNGDVLIWALPPAALPGAVPPPGSLPRVGGGRMVVTQRLRVTSDTFTSAITAVRLLREGTLLVQGGQSIEQPEGLSLLHIPPHKV